MFLRETIVYDCLSYVFNPVFKQIVAASQKVTYIYSASGGKLATNANGSLTYYRSVMVYGNDNKLLYILTPEGTVTRNEGSSGTTYTYNYFKKDHIGSTRAVLSAVDDTLQTVQSTDYYPFGLAFSTNNLNKNKYLFSGKELQDGNLGGSMLGLYDFGARHYDPFIGRWLTVDLYAKVYPSVSPYNYCLNNPVNLVDLLGLSPTKIDSVADGKGGWYYVYELEEITVTAPKDQDNPHHPIFYIPSWDFGPVGSISGDNLGPINENFNNGGGGNKQGTSSQRRAGSFPLLKYTDSYKNKAGYGYFGANRAQGKRKHAGVDFYGELGDLVYAILPGIVISNPQTPFIANTSLYAIEIDHGDYIGRYCEIYDIPPYSIGDHVYEGQFLGRIGQYKNESPMLHFEMFEGTMTGPLTNRSNMPYQRRGDLMDPTNYIDKLTK